MKTLMIKDLALTEELDSKAMAAVHGGLGYYPSYDYYKSDSSIHIDQDLTQTQINPTGNGSAIFGGSVNASNVQIGQNNVHV